MTTRVYGSGTPAATLPLATTDRLSVNQGGVVRDATVADLRGVAVQDEGAPVISATTLNFVGPGVSVSSTGSTATVTVSGGGSGSAYVPGDTPLAFSNVEPTTSTLNQYGGHFLTGSIAAGSTLTTTSLVTRTPRGRIASGGFAVDAIAGIQTRARVSTAAPFRFVHVFSPDNDTTTAVHRLFIGLTTRTSFTDVNPSTLTNMIGIGYDSGDTQFQFMRNDGTGSATKVALGASFAKPTARADKLWRVVLEFDGTTLTYALTDLSTNTTASGTATTDLPANTVFLLMDSYISAGGTSANAGLLHVSNSLRSVY